MQAGKLLAVVLLCMRSSTVLYHLLELIKGGEVYIYKSDLGKLSKQTFALVLHDVWVYSHETLTGQSSVMFGRR